MPERRTPAETAGDWRQDLARCGRLPFLRELSVYAVATYRLGRWNDARPRSLSRALVACLHWSCSRVVESLTGITLPKTADIGPGLRIYHSGPVVVHADAVIGRDCTLRHGVTIGERTPRGGVPRLGDRVDVGAYAQLLGPIVVGSDVKVGALALLQESVPDGSVVLAPRAVVVRRGAEPAGDEAAAARG